MTHAAYFTYGDSWAEPRYIWETYCRGWMDKATVVNGFRGCL